MKIDEDEMPHVRVRNSRGKLDEWIREVVSKNLLYEMHDIGEMNDDEMMQRTLRSCRWIQLRKRTRGSPLMMRMSPCLLLSNIKQISGARRTSPGKVRIRKSIVHV